MDKKNVLLIEDEVKLARFMELELQHEGYEVHVENDGAKGYEEFSAEKYDILLLDLMLPNLSGIEICRRIRKSSDIPIIMLSAKGEINDKVSGLDCGANDYMTKPFSIEELFARMRVALKDRERSAPGALPQTMVFKELTVELQSYCVRYSNEVIDLTKREYDLLVYMLTNKNIVLSREQLLNAIWGYDYMGETNVVDVYIRYLRSKIDERFNTKIIHTVRGVGYVIKDEE